MLNVSVFWMCLTVKLVPIQMILVENATTDTVQARWTSVKGATGYRLTWASQSIAKFDLDPTVYCNMVLLHKYFNSLIHHYCASLCLLDDHIENINLGDNFNFYMIQGLHPGSEYTISINPVFGDVEGPVTARKIKTCNLNIST